MSLKSLGVYLGGGRGITLKSSKEKKMEIRTKFMRKCPKIIITITEGGREHSNKSTQEKGKAKPHRVPPAHSGKGEQSFWNGSVAHDHTTGFFTSVRPRVEGKQGPKSS